MNRLAIVFWFLLSPALAGAWVAPDASFPDPVLFLWFTQPQIAFEKAPSWLVAACTDPDFDRMWVFAQTSRPEGIYMLVSGTFWVDEDEAGAAPRQRVEEPYGDGEIILLRSNRRCDGLWSADNAFNDYFPENVGDQADLPPATSFFSRAPGGAPTVAEASIIRDLGLDLIRRDERALGGRQGFLRALTTKGDKDFDQDTAMIPLLRQFRREG